MRKLRSTASSLCILFSFFFLRGAPAFAEPRQELANLQEQLRIAQQTQTEQTNEIRLLRAEVERLKEKNSALNLELETARKAEVRVQELQTERAQLQGRFDALQKNLEVLQREAQDKEQALSIGTRAAQVQEERLQQELTSAKAALVKPEAARNAPDVPSDGAPQANPFREFVSTQRLRPEEASPRASAQTAYVVIQRVSGARDFLVVSIQNLPGTKEGSTLLLSEGDQPVAEVEISSLNASGLAMVFLTRALQEDLSSFQAGNTLSARLVVRASSSSAINSEEP